MTSPNHNVKPALSPMERWYAAGASILEFVDRLKPEGERQTDLPPFSPDEAAIAARCLRRNAGEFNNFYINAEYFREVGAVLREERAERLEDLLHDLREAFPPAAGSEA